MPENVLQCPLCAGERSQLFDRREFRGHFVINRLCRDCGLVYQSPRMTDEERENFYIKEYRSLYAGQAEPTERDHFIQAARAESLLAFARPLMVHLHRHLDIGCSLGALLQSFSSAYHCQSVGVEPGEAYRLWAQRDGKKVYSSLEELSHFEKERFDLISMAHVLEHLPQPVGYLAWLRQNLLTSDGWLLIEVPNLYAHDSFEVAHLTSFSAQTLRQTISKAGFEVARLASHGQPRSDVLPLYLTVFARPSVTPNETIHPEHFVTWKRRLGLLRRKIMERLYPNKAWKS